jgi:predicted ATP-dependent endonuclease of OLD family
MLGDFTIRNFRGFRNLVLPRLARVNLVVGKNNIGKSSLLEALRIYASNGLPEVLWEGITARDEHKQSKRASQALLGLFHDDTDIREGIEVGPTGDKLLISIQFRQPTPSEDGTVQYSLLENPLGDDLVDARIDLLVKSEATQRTLPLMRDFESYVRRPIGFRREQLRTETPPKMRSVFVTANGLTQERQAELWDEAILASLEADVITSLRLIVPSMDRVSLIGDKDDRGRSAFARWEGHENPTPLKRLGDGVNRLFGMALALVNSQAGLLLVDEVENGIHYSIQEGLWRLILDVSRRLNVQVFATSHSWDCIKAFQRAMSDHGTNEGLVTRLEARDGFISASEFDEAELGIAVREKIEIR